MMVVDVGLFVVLTRVRFCEGDEEDERNRAVMRRESSVFFGKWVKRQQSQWAGVLSYRDKPTAKGGDFFLVEEGAEGRRTVAAVVVVGPDRYFLLFI